MNKTIALLAITAAALSACGKPSPAPGAVMTPCQAATEHLASIEAETGASTVEWTRRHEIAKSDKYAACN